MPRLGDETTKLAKTRNFDWRVDSIDIQGASAPRLTIDIRGSAAQMLTAAELLPEIGKLGEWYSTGDRASYLARQRARVKKLDGDIADKRERIEKLQGGNQTSIDAANVELDGLLTARREAVRLAKDAYDLAVADLTRQMSVTATEIRSDSRAAKDDALRLLAKQCGPSLAIYATASARLDAAGKDIGQSAARLLGQRPTD